MKKCLLATLMLLGLFDLVGCSEGIEPGFANAPPTAVVAPPPAEKPAKYGIGVKTPPGMPRQG